METEQIVTDALTTSFYAPQPTRKGEAVPNPRFTSFVQVRGSIPLQWSQDLSNVSSKPPIACQSPVSRNRSQRRQSADPCHLAVAVRDPYFSAAALHFDELLGRYGSPITVLNLIKASFPCLAQRLQVTDRLWS